MAELNYTEVDDLPAVLSREEQAQLSDDTKQGEISLDQDVIEQFLLFGESRVNSYLAKQYKVPLSDAPPSVVQASLLVAKYYLLLRRGYLTDSNREEYDSTITWLEMIKEDELELELDDDSDLADVLVGHGIVTEMTFGTNLF